MEIKEIIDLKQQAEQEIKQTLDRLIETTGCKINSINLEMLPIHNVDGKYHEVVSGVIIGIGL